MNYRLPPSVDAFLRIVARVIGLATLVVLAFILWPLSLLALPFVIFWAFHRWDRQRATKLQAVHQKRANIARCWR